MKLLKSKCPYKNLEPSFSDPSNVLIITFREAFCAILLFLQGKALVTEMYRWLGDTLSKLLPTLELKEVMVSCKPCKLILNPCCFNTRYTLSIHFLWNGALNSTVITLFIKIFNYKYNGFKEKY